VSLSAFPANRTGSEECPPQVLWVVSELVMTILITRWLKPLQWLDTLRAVGTSIRCTTAIVATGVLFAGNTIMVGLFQGTSIHGMAQVTGAGLIYDRAIKFVSRPAAANVAIISKGVH